MIELQVQAWFSGRNVATFDVQLPQGKGRKFLQTLGRPTAYKLIVGKENIFQLSFPPSRVTHYRKVADFTRARLVYEVA